MARLFHSLVVCGAGLTLLDCGGRFAGQQQPTDEGAGGASAGAATTPAGGSHAGAGSASGGTPANGGIGPIVPMTAEDQWVCDGPDTNGCGQNQDASGISVQPFRLTAPCMVDRYRPRSQQDCADSDWFNCLAGEFQGRPVLFNCRCAPAGDCSCPQLDASCARVVETEPGVCNENFNVCGCAWTCILK